MFAFVIAGRAPHPCQAKNKTISLTQSITYKDARKSLCLIKISQPYIFQKTFVCFF